MGGCARSTFRVSHKSQKRSFSEFPSLPPPLPHLFSVLPSLISITTTPSGLSYRLFLVKSHLIIKYDNFLLSDSSPPQPPAIHHHHVPWKGNVDEERLCPVENERANDVLETCALRWEFFFDGSCHGNVVTESKSVHPDNDRKNDERPSQGSSDRRSSFCLPTVSNDKKKEKKSDRRNQESVANQSTRTNPVHSHQL